MTVTCRFCEKEYDVPATPEQLTAWKTGLLIQVAMPNLTANQREMLLTQTCGPCWDKLFLDDRRDERD